MFERSCLRQRRLFTFSHHYASHEVSCGMLKKVRGQLNYLKLSCFLHYPLTVWSHIFTGCCQGGKVTFGNKLCTFNIVAITERRNLFIFGKPNYIWAQLIWAKILTFNVYFPENHNINDDNGNGISTAEISSFITIKILKNMLKGWNRYGWNRHFRCCSGPPATRWTLIMNRGARNSNSILKDSKCKKCILQGQLSMSVISQESTPKKGINTTRKISWYSLAYLYIHTQW